MDLAESNLIDYLRLLKARKNLIILVTLVVTAGAGVVSMLLPKQYRSEAILLPISSPKGGGAAAAALGGIGGLLDLGSSSQSAQLMVLLKSRTLAERVINKMNLLPMLIGDRVDTPMQVAASKLRELMEFGEDKKLQTITIAAKANSPELAADIANTYAEELRAFIQASAFTQAKHYRIYLEEQVSKNKRAFLEAGKELNNIYKDGRVSHLDSKLTIPIDPIPQKKTSSDSVEAFLSTLETPPSNTGKVATASEVTDNKSNFVENVPQQAYLQYLTLRREIMGKMSALIAQQYEMAKLEEAKDELRFQIVDRAQAPLIKCWPDRTGIVLTAFTMSLVLTCLGVIVYDRKKLATATTSLSKKSSHENHSIINYGMNFAHTQQDVSRETA